MSRQNAVESGKNNRWRNIATCRANPRCTTRPGKAAFIPGMRRVKLGGIKLVGQHLDGCPGWAAQLDCYREMQRLVTVTIVAPLTYSVAVTPRSERVGFNSQRSWAFISVTVIRALRRGGCPWSDAGPEIRSGINLSASSLSGRAHGNEAFMRMIALAAGRPRFCLPGQTKPFALSLSLMAMEDTTT